MASIEELRSIIRRPIEEGMPKAMAMAMGMFDKQQADADKEVGREMSNLSKRYISVLQAITGVKDGWVASPSPHLLSIDNEDAGITIDIHWEVDLGTGNADVTVELNRRKGAEGPGAKWKSKFHIVKNIKPTSMNLSPAKIMTDGAVRRFLKENAEGLLSSLMEDGEGWLDGMSARLAERKGTPYGKQHGSKEADMWGGKHGEKKEVGARDKATGKRKRSGHSKQAKKMARKGERQSGKKEIQARMRGEELELAEGINKYDVRRALEAWQDAEAIADSYEEDGDPRAKQARAEAKRLKKDMEALIAKWEKQKAKSRAYSRGRAGAMRSVGMVRTRSGKWESTGLAEARMDPYAMKVKRAMDGLAKKLPKTLQASSKGRVPWKLERRDDYYKARDGLSDGVYFTHNGKGVAASPSGDPYVSVTQWSEGDDEFSVRAGLDFEEGGATDFVDETVSADETVKVLSSKVPAAFQRWLKRNNFTFVQSEETGTGTVEELRSIIYEGKPKGPVKGGGQGYWSKKEKKGELKKKERRSKGKEIRQQMRGEDDDITMDDLERIAEAMAIGATGAYDVPSPVPFAKKASLAGRRHWRKQLRKYGIPMGAQEMMMELAAIAPSLPPTDRKLVDKVMNMTWYGPEDLGNEERNAYVDAIKKLHKRIFGKVKGQQMRGN